MAPSNDKPPLAFWGTSTEESAPSDASALESPLRGRVGKAFVVALGVDAVHIFGKHPSKIHLINDAERFVDQAVFAHVRARLQTRPPGDCAWECAHKAGLAAGHGYRWARAQSANPNTWHLVERRLRPWPARNLSQERVLHEATDPRPAANLLGSHPRESPPTKPAISRGVQNPTVVETLPQEPKIGPTSATNAPGADVGWSLPNIAPDLPHVGQVTGTLK